MSHPLNLFRRRWVELDGLMVPRNANAFGHGHGHGVGSRAVWTPDSWGTDRLVDYTADDVLTSGGLVTAFVDQGGTRNATQGNAANQGQLVSHAPFGGKNAVHFDGTQPVWYDHSAHTYTGTTHSWATIVDNDNIVTAGQYLYHGTVPSFVLQPVPTGFSTEQGFYDIAHRSFGAGTATLNASSELQVYNDTASTASLYRAGALVAAPVAYVATGVDSPAGRGLGGRYGAGTAPVIDLYLRRFVGISRLPTASEIPEWFAFSLKDSGV